MLFIHFLMTNAEWNVKIEFLKRNIFDSAKYQSNVFIRSIPQLFKHFIVTQQQNTQNKRKKKRNFNCMPSIFFWYKWAHSKIVNVKIQRQRKFCRRSDVVVLLFESFSLKNYGKNWWSEVYWHYWKVAYRKVKHVVNSFSVYVVVHVFHVIIEMCVSDVIRV